MSACPSLDLLQSPSTEVSAHLAGCPACQSLVALMDPGDDDPFDCARAEVLIAAGAGRPLAGRDAVFLPAHLARCRDCRQIALEPTAGAALELPEVARETYVLGAEIGRGGMGRILSAYDRRIGRTVAIKEMLSSQPLALARFEREARITARLQHPGIVSIYEVARWPDGRPFYAMPILPGRTLREAIAAAPKLEGRLALIPAVIAAAEAVAYAHSRRIIHRDLTPSNILLGSFGETIVIDWGVAKDLDAGEDDQRESLSGQRQPGLTVAGTVVGTVAYIPPEQADGAAVDERADVYALGAILHHVLTGRHPYHGEDVSMVTARLRAREPPRLAPAGLVPRELVAIVRRAMAVDAGQRYRTAMALVEDLRLYLSGGRTLPDYAAFVLGAIGRRRRWAAAAFLVTLGLTALVYRMLPRTYHVELRLEEQERFAFEQGRSSSPVMPQVSSTAAAIRMMRSRQNLEALATRADSWASLVAARSPFDRLGEWFGVGPVAPVSENERRMRLVDELERRTVVEYGWSYPDAQNRIDIGVDWPEPRAAYRLAVSLQESYLQARQMIELGAASEALSVLVGREKALRYEIEEAVQAIDQREKRRRRAGRSGAAEPQTVRADREANEQVRALLSYKRHTLADLEASRQRRITELRSSLDGAGPSRQRKLESEEALVALREESPLMLALRQDTEALARRVAVPAGLQPAYRRAGLDRSEADLANAWAPGTGDDADLATARGQLRFQVVAYTSLAQRIDDARIELETARATFKHRHVVVRPAQVPSRAVSPQLYDALRVGLMLAAALAALVAVVVDWLARRREA